MAELDNHGQLRWNKKTGRPDYVVAWPIDQEKPNFNGKITGDLSGSSSPYGDAIQVQGCYAPGKSSTKMISTDKKVEVTISAKANSGNEGLYAAIAIGYASPDADPLPSGYKIEGDQTYYVTALQPPSNGSDEGQELKVMPEGAGLKFSALSKGCVLHRLVEYTDDESEVGRKWKPVKNTDKVRHLGTFALISNGK